MELEEEKILNEEKQLGRKIYDDSSKWFRPISQEYTSSLNQMHSYSNFSMIRIKKLKEIRMLILGSLHISQKYPTDNKISEQIMLNNSTLPIYWFYFNFYNLKPNQLVPFRLFSRTLTKIIPCITKSFGLSRFSAF